MTDFTLSSRKDKALPSTIAVDGSAFEINPGFRTMLKIFRMLDDPEILEEHKSGLLCKWFFPQEVPNSWEESFKWFANGGAETEAGSRQKDIDYEFDAPEIYASFMQLYGIDLFETELHWWQFRALVSGCTMCRCALHEKLRLRNLDVSKCADKAAAQRAKDSVQIPCNVGENERLIIQALQERLIKGEDISDLLR